jgi:hypothetical protein
MVTRRDEVSENDHHIRLTVLSNGYAVSTIRLEPSPLDEFIVLMREALDYPRWA